MNIQEFIRESLSQIMAGVQEAKATHTRISPSDYEIDYSRPTPAGTVADTGGRLLFMVEFDLAVVPNNLDKAARQDWLFILFRLVVRSLLAMQLLLLLVLNFLFQLATNKQYMRPNAINTQNISATKPFERFQQFAKKVVAVPKTEIDKREATWKKLKRRNGLRTKI